MKTIALTITALILTCSIYAQLKKGKWMVGGTGDFSHSNIKSNSPGFDADSKLTTYRFAPGAGYFFMDRFCGGLRITVSNMKGTDDYTGIFSTYHNESKSSGFGVSPFLRYYFLPADRKVNLFADGSYSYNDDKTKIKSVYVIQNPPPGQPSSTEGMNSTAYKSSSYSIAAGPAFFINPKVSFELSIGYILRKAKKQDLTSNGVMFGTGFQVYFGK